VALAPRHDWRSCGHRALRCAVKSLQMPEKASSLEDNGADQGSRDARVQIPLPDKFGMVYTCGKCNTRNAISVTRVAWNSGVVVATCRGCGAKHLLADNEARMDLGNDTGFRNIVQLMEARGEDVTKLDSSDPEALKARNLTLGADDRLRLLDDDGSLLEDDGSGLPAPPALRLPPDDDPPPPSLQPPPQEEVEDVDVAPLILTLPDGWQQRACREGGARPALAVDSQFGLLHVPVPREAGDQSRLVVEGMVEVGLGPGYPHWIQSSGEGDWEQTTSWKVGDAVAVNLPDGVVARIKITDNALEDAMVRVGFPVVVLPPSE